MDERKQEFARQFGAPFVGELRLPVVERDSPGFDALLVLTDRRLVLHVVGPGGPGPVFADFVSRAAAARGGRGAGQDILARAVGARQGRRPIVVDATAGLGCDAAMLARFGCRVTAIERSPIVAALLRDGLHRALHHVRARQELGERLSIVRADAREWLAALPVVDRPDVVYLDPMYTEHVRRQAAPKKEMQVLRRLLGTDDDAGELFAVALRVARERVVVKRHQHAAPLGGAPSITFTGRSTRFDVYLRIDADRVTDGGHG